MIDVYKRQVRDRIDDGDGRYHYEVNKNETMLAREKPVSYTHLEFDVEIKEVLSRVQKVKAESLDDAINKAMDMYYACLLYTSRCV